MTVTELVEYWIKSSDKDFSTMLNLYRNKGYCWSLFIGHLVVEKLLKGYFVKITGKNPPFSHNLPLLAEKADLNLSEEQKDILRQLTAFNINTRYPDYKYEFYKKCNKKFTGKNIEKIKKLRKWLKNQVLE